MFFLTFFKIQKNKLNTNKWIKINEFYIGIFFLNYFFGKKNVIDTVESSIYDLKTNCFPKDQKTLKTKRKNI